MQLTPTKFLIPAGDDTRRFRINLEYFRKGHGGYQAKILKVVLPEAEQKSAEMAVLEKAAVEAPDDVEGEEPPPETAAMDAAVEAMPEGGYPPHTTWTLNHCPPGDSWYLERIIAEKLDALEEPVPDKIDPPKPKPLTPDEIDQSGSQHFTF